MTMSYCVYLQYIIGPSRPSIVGVQWGLIRIRSHIMDLIYHLMLQFMTSIPRHLNDLQYKVYILSWHL